MIGDWIGIGMQGGINAAFQEDAQDWQKTMMRNRLQWMVHDAVKAGINPRLLVAGGASGGYAGSPMASVANPQIGSSALRRAQKRQASAARDELITRSATNESLKEQAVANAEAARNNAARTVEETRRAAADADQAEIFTQVYRDDPGLARDEVAARGIPSNALGVIQKWWKSEGPPDIPPSPKRQNSGRENKPYKMNPKDKRRQSGGAPLLYDW